MKLDFCDVASATALDEVWGAIQDGRRARAQRRRVSGAVVLVLLLGVGLATAWSTRPTPPLAPLTWAQTPVAGALPPGEHLLADGSRLTLRAATRLTVTENSGPALSFTLDEGLAHFSVTPETGRTWRVFAGDTVVEVVGTVFQVEHTGARVRVVVERGVVRVSGPRVPGREVLLAAGQALDVVDPVVRAETPPSAPAPLPPRPPVAREVTARRQPAVEDAGLPLPPALEVDLAEALRSADALRASGRDEEAMAALQQLVEQHPAAPEAALAAFTLARLHQQRGSVELARRWYQQALSLGLAEPLRSSAQRALHEVP